MIEVPLDLLVVGTVNAEIWAQLTNDKIVKATNHIEKKPYGTHRRFDKPPTATITAQQISAELLKKMRSVA
jgi:hypothetical protein